jgi:hypothetical protein
MGTIRGVIYVLIVAYPLLYVQAIGSDWTRWPGVQYYNGAW